MRNGIELIAEERQEQIKKHGRTLEHDAELNAHGEMKSVAIYLLDGANQNYPRNWALDYQFKLDRKTPKEKLIIAGALIAAEIDRIQSL